jgi:monofunctional biosynthetic peptidoglycan transglycosylase
VLAKIFRYTFLGIFFCFAVILVLGAAYRFIPPTSTLMIGRLLTLQGFTRDYVPLRDISPSLRRAVIGAEDGRFCQHQGVDWEAINTVMEKSGKNGPKRGASTISMQVAKNLFLWPHKSYARKAIEIPIAIYLDYIWPKSRMLEVYLNIAEWGDGIFGAEAAAQAYFSKSAKNLSSHEAALLAAALPNPLKRNPAHARAGHKRYAARVLGRMRAGVDTSCLR